MRTTLSMPGISPEIFSRAIPIDYDRLANATRALTHALTKADVRLGRRLGTPPRPAGAMISGRILEDEKVEGTVHPVPQS
jgi:leucyl aminopeptidase (aminopeptidase T)